MNNERIRELALQAGWNGYDALDERNEKFVELIIKECTDVLHDNALLNRHISHALNEHFGID